VQEKRAKLNLMICFCRFTTYCEDPGFYRYRLKLKSFAFRNSAFVYISEIRFYGCDDAKDRQLFPVKGDTPGGDDLAQYHDASSGGAAAMFDGNLDTSWKDSNRQSPVFRFARAEAVCSYQWATGNELQGKACVITGPSQGCTQCPNDECSNMFDPSGWELQGSNDEVDWKAGQEDLAEWVALKASGPVPSVPTNRSTFTQNISVLPPDNLGQDTRTWTGVASSKDGSRLVAVEALNGASSEPSGFIWTSNGISAIVRGFVCMCKCGAVIGLSV
jgi:hypothetical protein